MYSWLADALDRTFDIVTANRRLARVLKAHHAQDQLAAGRTSWPTPPVFGWSDWLTRLLDNSVLDDSLPTRLNKQQCELLWERCIRNELRTSPANINGLVRLAMEAWTRIQEYDVPFEECRDAAFGPDQRMFAGAATRYGAILSDNNWIDDAGRTGLLCGLAEAQKLLLPTTLYLAGFDRIVPQAKRLIREFERQGVDVIRQPRGRAAAELSLDGFENSDAELRAAGAWARAQLQADPAATVAIVAGNLDEDAERTGRLVLEGLVPGWQFGDARHKSALNVSYGRRMREFPAVAIALLALRWLVDDIPARDVSLLLRSSLIGGACAGGRSRLELELREMPDRGWSPALLLRALRADEDDEDAIEFLRAVRWIDDQRKSMPRSASPAQWAEFVDGCLSELKWPGTGPQDSFEYQLVNRWRELLNDLARLELVSPQMSFATALRRLATLAGDTVFQAESESAAVQLLGPLEAAGMEFTDLWVSGLSAGNWPPAGRPSPVLSRKLQREYGMPDADPADTSGYAKRVVSRLVCSARVVRCSYPRTEGDAEQTPTTLLGDLPESGDGKSIEPDWFASSLVRHRSLKVAERDTVPAVTRDEHVAGGSATVQKQLSNPFAAFAAGRLGIRYLPVIATGLAANLRGNLIHDALRTLYECRPTSADIASWPRDELGERIKRAVGSAFARHERHADPVLRQLFALERARAEKLLARVVELDRGRDAFAIHEVEGRAEAELNGVKLALRYDRIDRLPDDDLVILDYKTGAFKRFLQADGHPRDFQLVVYACTLPRDVAGLGLVNIDSREVAMDGAGEPFGDEQDWHRRLGGWKAEVRNAADAISRGDVRVNAHLPLNDARPLALLNRFAELRRDL